MQDYNLDDMQLANPSILNAQQEDKKAILKGLEAEADSLNPSMEKELLEATIKYWKVEVL